MIQKYYFPDLTIGTHYGILQQTKGVMFKHLQLLIRKKSFHIQASMVKEWILKDKKSYFSSIMRSYKESVIRGSY